MIDGAVELGRVSGVFGVRGEVRLYLHHPESDLLRTERTVWLERDDGTTRKVRLSARPGAGRRVIGRLAGVGDPESARDWIGARIYIEKAALPALADGEFYVHELLGLTVVCDGRTAGRLAAVHDTPGGGVLEIDGPDGAVFALATRIVRVDAASGTLVLEPGALGLP